MSPILSPLRLLLVGAALLPACTSMTVSRSVPRFVVAGMQLDTYRGSDDLLTGGLGAAGLRSPVPPAFADPAHPTAAELRRRAIWSNWRGIADLAPGGGYGELYGTLQPVPGREYRSLAKLPGAAQPHRLLVQLPDAFDAGQRCIVVTASSGSRGVYGAIALAGAWGLPRGCVVAYTDKGTGTGYVDTATGQGTALSGLPAGTDEMPEFSVPQHVGDGPAPIAVKHAHSRDNPEAGWGRHVKQAAEFALSVLEDARPQDGPFTFANTRVIAVGVSNGGGAVLRAAELDGDWLDGVVAVSPQVYPEGGRPLYDYVTEAAIWMPCALDSAAFDNVALARPGGARAPSGATRCASLKQAGLLAADSAPAQAEQARAHLHAAGWTDAAIAAGALSTTFDLWRAVAVTYASSYARTGPDDMPCGYLFRATDGKGQPRAPTDVERAAWWSDASGIPPGAGVGIVDSQASGSDPLLPGLRCLRALQDTNNALARRLQASIAATRAKPPRAGLPVLVVHGIDDGLVPEAFSSAPYVRMATAAGGDVRYWRVDNAQHFDAFLGVPVLGARYLPMLPYAYRGLDAMWAHIVSGRPLPGDATIATRPREVADGKLAPLGTENLGRLP